jgi:hypothetical protein
MTLVDGCTTEMLYEQLQELGVNIAELRKTNPDMARLEAMYYEHLDKKLSAVMKNEESVADNLDN